MDAFRAVPPPSGNNAITDFTLVVVRYLFFYPRVCDAPPPPLYRLTYFTSCPGFVSRPATPSQGGVPPGSLYSGRNYIFDPYFGLKKGFAEGPCPGGSSYLGDSQQLFSPSHKHPFFSSIFKSFTSFIISSFIISYHSYHSSYPLIIIIMLIRGSCRKRQLFSSRRYF